MRVRRTIPLGRDRTKRTGEIRATSLGQCRHAGESTMTQRSDSILRIPSRQVLGPLPERVVVFLRGVGSHNHARAAMARGGYTQAHHREGVRLLTAVLTYGAGGLDPIEDENVRAAHAEIVAWVRTNFSRLRAAVERMHGERGSVFSNIEAPDPAEAVVALATLLRRVSELEQGSAVRETLVDRGLDPRECARLAELVARGQTLTATPGRGSVPDSSEEDLIALYRWHADWANTARSLIRRKDILAVLGLRRRGKRATAGGIESTQDATDFADV
jgi:hypothetical protein